MREGAQGAQPWGSGGGTPHAEERSRRGPEAMGDLFAPLWGAIKQVANKTTFENDDMLKG